MLDEFEDALEELRVAYEKYFVGVDRQAPASRHRNVKAQLRRLQGLHMRSTAIRFRLNGLRARLVTFEHYWNRVLSQIEKGTYRRDIAQRVQRRKAADPTPADARAAPGRPGQPPPPPVPGMNSPDVHRLFERLVAAKQAAGEDTKGLTVRALARKLSRELPKLQQRHGGPVKFEVATVRGKVTLKARSVAARDRSSAS